MKPEKKYRWATPHDWLIEKMGSMDFHSVVSIAYDLIGAMDSDALQDLFQGDMIDDGYFDDDDSWFTDSSFWQDGEDLAPCIPDIGAEGDCVYLANPNDIFGGGDGPFYEHFYIVTMSEFGPMVYVNAANLNDAIDEAVDFCEEMGWEGLFLQDEYIDELIHDAKDDGRDDPELYLQDHLTGGNHNRYLSSHNVTAKKIVRGHE